MKKIVVALILSMVMAICAVGCSAPQSQLTALGASINYPSEWTGDEQDLSNGKMLGLDVGISTALSLDLGGEVIIAIANTAGSPMAAEDFVAMLKEQGVSAEITGDKVDISLSADGMHAIGTALVKDGSIDAIALATADDSAWKANEEALRKVINSLSA